MSKFVKCGPDLTVNRDEVASIEWDRQRYSSGAGHTALVVTLNSGVQHRILHRSHGYDAVDCYKIEKDILSA